MRPKSDLTSVIAALDFQKDHSDVLHGIPAANWPRLLKLTDQAQLTLPLAVRRRGCLPPELQSRVAHNLACNAERSRQVKSLYRSIDQELRWRGVEFVVLKGMTHFPSFCDDLAHRPQFDIDLYCPPESAHAAAEAIGGLGYEPVGSGHATTADHLPAMIRKTGYQWRGDYYDPELPLIVEIHDRFWNADREAFGVNGAEAFWSRRTRRVIGGCSVPGLHPVDDLAYTAWHLVKHLLRGNLRLYHVYELAHFLDRTCSADAFWREWQSSAVETRLAEPLAFRLAHEWFGCRLNTIAVSEIERLPRSVDRWFMLFAWSPVTAMDSPNKDELFLHLALAKGTAARCRIATRKLLPMNPPRVVMDAHLKGDTPSFRIRRRLFRARFLLRRALHHIRSWSPVVQSGLRWWWQTWRAA